MSMIFGIGLPRCAGQSLQRALAILTGKRCWHSLGRAWDVLDPNTDAGAVEVWQPTKWLEEHFPGSKYILNIRYDPLAWLNSCEKVYHKSINYNNPLWQNPLHSFEQYYHEYNWIKRVRCDYRGRFLEHDFIGNPTWDRLCGFLEVDVPTVPFPNIDIHGRQQQPPDGLNQNNFNFDFGIGY